MRVVFTPEVQVVACVDCRRPLSGCRDPLPSGYFDLCDEAVWASFLGPIAGTEARAPSYQALVSALPDVPFTRAELRDQAMVPQGSMGALMDRLLEEGLVVELDAFDPRFTGLGLRPKLYAKPGIDASACIDQWRTGTSA
ncbi:hypothetical protein FTX61_22335 [Nitriliruptoraceae bacterium ZYF776]|nr:hypothetical protein [Profundirhabdus halotolerans]